MISLYITKIIIQIHFDNATWKVNHASSLKLTVIHVLIFMFKQNPLYNGILLTLLKLMNMS